VGIARRAFSPCFSSCLEPGFGIGLHRSAPYEFNCAPDVGNDLQFAEEWLRFFLSEIRDLEGCGLLPSPVSESERPGAPSSWLDSTPRPGPPADLIDDFWRSFFLCEWHWWCSFLFVEFVKGFPRKTQKTNRVTGMVFGGLSMLHSKVA